MLDSVSCKVSCAAPSPKHGVLNSVLDSLLYVYIPPLRKMQPPEFAVREEASLFGALISAPNNTLPPELQFSSNPFPGADSFRDVLAATVTH